MTYPELKPDSKNARKRSNRANDTLEHSLRELGPGGSIVIDRRGNIMAGNGFIENPMKLV